MSQAQGVSIRDLQDELKGEVIVPDDPGYDEARQVFFKGIDRRPAGGRAGRGRRGRRPCRDARP